MEEMEEKRKSFYEEYFEIEDQKAVLVKRFPYFVKFSSLDRDNLARIYLTRSERDMEIVAKIVKDCQDLSKPLLIFEKINNDKQGIDLYIFLYASKNKRDVYIKNYFLDDFNKEMKL